MVKKTSLVCEAPHTLEPQKATRVCLRTMLNASEAPSNERHRLDSRNSRRRRDLHRLVLRGPLGVSDGLPSAVAAGPVSGHHPIATVGRMSRRSAMRSRLIAALCHYLRARPHQVIPSGFVVEHTLARRAAAAGYEIAVVPGHAGRFAKLLRTPQNRYIINGWHKRQHGAARAARGLRRRDRTRMAAMRHLRSSPSSHS